MARHAGTGLAVAGWVFAATMMVVVGVFQIIAGLTAVLHDNFYVNVRNYTFDLDVSTWGWIHIVLGALLLLTGLALTSGRVWAAAAGIVVAALSAINNFFFLPYYPIWSLLIIAVDVFVIWSLARMISAATGGGLDRWAESGAPAAEPHWARTTGSGSASSDVKQTPAETRTGTTGGARRGDTQV